MFSGYREVLDTLCEERGLDWSDAVRGELVKSWGRMTGASCVGGKLADIGDYMRSVGRHVRGTGPPAVKVHRLRSLERTGQHDGRHRKSQTTYVASVRTEMIIAQEEQHELRPTNHKRHRRRLQALAEDVPDRPCGSQPTARRDRYGCSARL